jgi:hypothetical protein
VPADTSSSKAATVSSNGVTGSGLCAQYSSTWSVPSRRRLPSIPFFTTPADRPSAVSGYRPASVGSHPTLVLIRTRSRTPGRLASQRPSSASLCPPKPLGSSQNE